MQSKGSSSLQQLRQQHLIFSSHILLYCFFSALRETPFFLSFFFFPGVFFIFYFLFLSGFKAWFLGPSVFKMRQTFPHVVFFSIYHSKSNSIIYWWHVLMDDHDSWSSSWSPPHWIIHPTMNHSHLIPSSLFFSSDFLPNCGNIYHPS